jgi:hypothetical protein
MGKIIKALRTYEMLKSYEFHEMLIQLHGIEDWEVDENIGKWGEIFKLHKVLQ